MDLYILRHAEAGEAPRDADRELTERGHVQARAVAAGIARLKVGITAIASSPLPRAMQTARPVADALGLKIETADTLASGRGPEEAIALLSDYDGDAGLLLVGHEPQLSGIILQVTGGRVHMRKAMLAHVELQSANPAYGALAWLLTWKHLRSIGAS